MHRHKSVHPAERHRAALARDRHGTPHQRACGCGSERNDEPRPHQRDLAIEPPAARGHLVPVRLFMQAPFAARLVLEVLHHVGEVKLGAIEAGFGKRAVKQLAGRSDERLAGQILLVARLLADEHESGVARTLAEHGLRRPTVQRAAPARRNLRAQFVQ